MQREWKAIDGFEGLYEVSNYGEVKALERLVENNGGLQKKHERILKPNKYNKAHQVVVLCKDGKTYPRLVHRLVAMAFIPNPEGKPVVDHIDTNPMNNRVDNLRWATVQENCMNPLTRINNSRSKKGHPYYGRPLTEEEIEKIRLKNTGRKASRETKERLSLSHKTSEKSIKASFENLKKAQQANVGRKHSDETKNKISASHLGVHKGMTWKVIDGKRVWLKQTESEE